MTRPLHPRVGLGLVVAAVLAAVLFPAPVRAQVFGDVIRSALDNDCAQLSVLGGTFTSVKSQGFGTNLASLCFSQFEQADAANTIGSQLTSGALPDQSRLGLEDEERRLRRRLRDRRGGDGGGNGAAAPGPLGGLYVAGDYEYFDKDVTRFEPGYQSDTYGGTLGVDYAFASWLVAGLALNYANTNGRFFQDGGTFDTDSYGAFLYGSLQLLDNFFVDLIGGYTRKKYTTERQINFSMIRDDVVAGPFLVSRVGTAVGSTDGDEWRVSSSVGYDFVVGRLTVGPRVGMHYRHTTIDGFTERSQSAVGDCRSLTGGNCFVDDPPIPLSGPLTGTGLELVFDRQTEESLQLTAGIFLALPVGLGFGVLVPQATVEYVHEFLRDQRKISFRFAEDNTIRTKFTFQNDPPDRDYLNAGVGLVLILPRGISTYANYTALVGYGDQQRHTVAVGVRVEF